MRTIHVVSHTHWDREWYRTFQQFRLGLVRLVDGLLDILESVPGYRHFTLDGQTILLDDYLQLRPEREQDLRSLVRGGRILIGPWHVLPDMFLVGAEAHIRNLLQGARTARRFGSRMMVGYIPDPFGHPGQMPQILRGFGIETACLWRGVDVPGCEFWWQSPDGSRVFTAFLRDGYGNGARLSADDPRQFAAGLAERAGTLASCSAASSLLVMQGTDHMEPRAGTPKAIAHAGATLHGTRVVHSTLPRFIRAAREELDRKGTAIPVVEGELRACRRMHLLPGVLSARMWIKQRNRACERLLGRWAEPFSALRELAVPRTAQGALPGGSAGVVRQAWRLLMENHPHDSICGCSIDQVHEEMRVRFDQADQLGEELAQQGLEAIAGSVRTDSRQRAGKRPPLPGALPPPVGRAPSAALVVFNPLAGPRTDAVTATLVAPGAEAFDVVDETGAILPCQEEGLGTREIAAMTMDRTAIASAFGAVREGRVAGMTIQGMTVRRDGNEVHVDAVLASGGQPNLEAWNSGRALLDECIADPSISTYHARARSTSARLTVVVPEVPGLGYRTLWIRPRGAEEKPAVRLNPLLRALLPLGRLPVVQKLAARRRRARSPFTIENGIFRVEATADGTLTVVDRRDGVAWAGLNRIQDGGDRGDLYNYCPPETDQHAVARLKRVFVSRGAVRQSLELELELATPRGLAPDRAARSVERVVLPVKSFVTLYRGVPRIEVRTRVDNRARDHRLRVHFPAPFAASSAAHDGHFEVVERGAGVPDFDGTWVEQPRPEAPQGAFTSVTDGRKRLTIANRGLPEVEVARNARGNAEIALTLLRCVGWLSRDDLATRTGHAGPPSVETPAAEMPGPWEFEYAIVPGSGDAAYAEAWAFETPMRAVGTGLHDGVLPPRGSFVDAHPAAFRISAVKRAEDGSGLVVRGFNTTAEDLAVTLRPWRPFRTVRRVNLAEEPVARLAVDRTGAVRLPVRGHEIASVRFEG